MLGFRPVVVICLTLASLPPAIASADEPGDDQAEEPATEIRLADLPHPITSFGAAVTGDALYVYGGHTGEAHSYSQAEQSGELWRLDLEKPAAWKTISAGPRLQGLALVAHEGELIRVGGFTALNEKGADQNLQSQAGVARFDPGSLRWSDLPPLPEPRSSHDAAVVGDTLLVVGGWQLEGQADPRWHETAWSMNLAAETPAWKPLPTPPFQRRALAVAAHDGKLFVVGGMQREGGPTTRVDVWDPATAKWHRGPSLQGEPMEGFGCSAFATGGRLYVSTIHGNLQQLSADGKTWKILRQLPTARFFHRMLPLDTDRLLVLGGANMSSGKFEALEVLKLD